MRVTRARATPGACAARGAPASPLLGFPAAGSRRAGGRLLAWGALACRGLVIASRVARASLRARAGGASPEVSPPSSGSRPRLGRLRSGRGGIPRSSRRGARRPCCRRDRGGRPSGVDPSIASPRCLSADLLLSEPPWPRLRSALIERGARHARSRRRRFQREPAPEGIGDLRAASAGGSWTPTRFPRAPPRRG